MWVCITQFGDSGPGCRGLCAVCVCVCERKMVSPASSNAVYNFTVGRTVALCDVHTTYDRSLF